ncbi:hypothetical protein MCC_06900 [Rickettsia rhipicephali str. 3-7-female6-CWPP]|uniref:Uncharacterized protein n=1 Tax=Rickettsia rhipicephali (strain 3-7-female6-CWPP) TaxID=1105113 RepID=A0AAI8AAT4_RICR3|nr:hypothetical protein [Rickettsia rhipicephali]AFC72846.1 hypothetical protein MCC_06900 [Rickettsia rhipicephali str. 3-7-female6-CWPP]
MKRFIIGFILAIGERKISKFIEQFLKPYVINEELEASYKAMAQDTKAEEKANECG